MIQINSYARQIFAERILFSKSLAEKLQPPSDEPTAGSLLSSFVCPDLPGRPPELSFAPTASKSSKHQFPSRSSLDQPSARGLVLHFFANHELLALEIMALAILKFPDAPEAFLNGIVQTMIDEQRHMGFYLSRMSDLGISFGDTSLNGFFWRSLKNLSSPQDYVASMSMTFEQANLDFALHFEEEFRKLGDLETSNILRTVRKDEIGHVKHGVIWMNRWKVASDSLWKEYLSHVKFPMTPARAKGPRFDFDGRRAAGLPEDFIEELHAFSSSRGRPPVVYWFNPGCEEEVRAGRKGFVAPKAVVDLSSDLSPLMMFVGHSDDIVVVKHRPTISWISSMQDAGIEIPEFIEEDQLRNNSFKNRKLSQFQPWGWSSDADELSECLKTQLQYRSPVSERKPWEIKPWQENPYSKTFAAELREPDDLQAIRCTSLEELHRELARYFESKHSTVVVKTPISSSGRHTQLIHRAEGITDAQVRWIENQLSQFGQVLVEQWVERVCDVSFQFIVTDNGDVKLIDVTRFIVNRKGQYRGHHFGKLLEGLPLGIAELWHSTHQNGWRARFERMALKVGHSLAKAGYTGPAGIDGFIYRGPSQDEYRFQSLSEINPRYTMGRIALEISRHLVSKTPGIWLHLSRTDVEKAGYANFKELYNHASRVASLVTRKFSPTNIQLSGGCLFTNDPGIAKQVQTVLVLGATPEELINILTELNLHDLV